MATPQSSLIIKKYEGFGGNFLDSQYLGAAFDAGKPAMLETAMMKIFSSKSLFFTGKALLGMTGAKPFAQKEIDSDVFRWRLQGAERKWARVVELVETGNTAPGLNGTTFKVKLDLDYYHAPDVLFSEDNEVPLEIVEGPIADGSGFVYTLRVQSDNPTLFLDPKFLEVGREFSKVWTTVSSEFNDIYGTQQSPQHFLLESQLGYFAQSIHVTDKALRQQGRLGFEFISTDYSGKTKVNRAFMPYYEATMWEEFYRSMEVQLIYGKKSHKPSPNTKYWKKTGPGIREQMKDSWIQYYNGALSVTSLEDYLMNIFFARTDESNRKVVMMTGTIGSMLFHKALVAAANGVLTVDTNYIQKIASPSETPHLAYGYQFTRYRGTEGVVIDVVKNPMYDSLEYCKATHPMYSDKPIDSARMTFLDFGTSEGENNILYLKEKDSYTHGYTVGMVGPNGPIKGGQVNNLKHGYDVAAQGSAGIVIKDVTRCGEYIYAADF